MLSKRTAGAVAGVFVCGGIQTPIPASVEGLSLIGSVFSVFGCNAKPENPLPALPQVMEDARLKPSIWGLNMKARGPGLDILFHLDEDVTITIIADMHMKTFQPDPGSVDDSLKNYFPENTVSRTLDEMSHCARTVACFFLLLCWSPLPEVLVVCKGYGQEFPLFLARMCPQIGILLCIILQSDNQSFEAENP